MGKFFLLLLIMVALAIGIIEVVGSALSERADYAQFSWERSVILKDGERYVVLQGSTLYDVVSGELVDGCYRLTGPSEPGLRGTAELAWPWCEKAQ